MHALVFIAAMLTVDPGAAEQKLIQDAKAELAEARKKAGGPVGVNAAAVTPHLNLLALKVGASGSLGFVDDGWTARIVENKSDDNGVFLLVEVRRKDGHVEKVRLHVAGATSVTDQLRLGCVVTGVQTEGDLKTFQLHVVERYDAFGALIKD